MPRQPRLDAPGTLHHVWAGGSRPARYSETLAREIATDQGITETELRSGRRMRKVSEARRAFCKSSVGELGFPAAAVARLLGVTTSAVVRAARRNNYLTGCPSGRIIRK